MSDISEAYHDIFYGDGDEFIDPTKDCGHEDAYYDCPEDFSGEDLTSYKLFSKKYKKSIYTTKAISMYLAIQVIIFFIPIVKGRFL